MAGWLVAGCCSVVRGWERLVPCWRDEPSPYPGVPVDLAPTGAGSVGAGARRHLIQLKRPLLPLVCVVTYWKLAVADLFWFALVALVSIATV